MFRERSFLIGLVSGAVFIAAVFVAGKMTGVSRYGPPSEMVAKAGDEVLTRGELRERASRELVPVENDEYDILRRAAEEWVEESLFKLEAKASNLSLKDFFLNKVWSRVKVSGVGLGRDVLTQRRHAAYEEEKKKLVAELSEKYHAAVLLQKPRSYIEGLAAPPSRGAPAGESLSEAGTAPSKGPADAPVVITEFADFHCPFCRQGAATLQTVMKNFGASVRWEFHHFPLTAEAGQGSFLTHEAAACAQEQGRFWEYHDALFAMESAPAKPDLFTLAHELGLEEGRFRDCLESGRYQDYIRGDLAAGEARGIEGTPAYFVNKASLPGAVPYQRFADAIQKELGGPGPEPSEAEGPAVVTFADLAGRPSQGPEKAPITLVEFSDFHCPFCQRVTPTIEKLMSEYSGKIRRVWRHYPLAMHPGADRTHEASECAHEQGKFWEYHHKLFETQGGARDDEALVRLAKETGLKEEKFKKCLQGGKYRELVQKEIARGNEVGVDGTPTFFVNGKPVIGAQPYEAFKSTIQQELGKPSP